MLEGWKAIGRHLGLDARSVRAVRKRLLGWEREEGLPVQRRRGRVFAEPERLDDWAGKGRSVAAGANK